MPETPLPLAYWNQLANQLILISSLLSGFSIAVIASLLVYDTNNRMMIYILKAATVAACCFITTVFAMTKILMMTTPGYPMSVVESNFLVPRIIGIITYMLGLISLLTVISLAGWTKSRSTGIFTTIIGVLTFLLLLSTLVEVQI